ncbi:MAG: MBL fold metallo-hydrolase [Deltaproteobacteria bacterium]|nr:MBL fold metallo-hydrolase [Deltaproteobacteria bacterium]
MTIQEMLDRMAWLGHDTFRIDGSKTVFFDPYDIKTAAAADLVLVTHEHFDHCSPDDIQKLLTPETVIVTEKDSARKLSGTIEIMKPGDSLTIGGVIIEAVPAYNVDKNFHPKKNGWLGFVLEMDGVRIYHAGDTDFIPEMNDLNVDIALLPVSGTYVMTADEAVEAALAIDPGVAVPMHYGAIVGNAGNAEVFEQKLAGRVDVRIY